MNLGASRHNELPEWHDSKDWVMADAQTLKEHIWIFGKPKRWLAWNESCPPAKRRTIKALRLRIAVNNTTIHSVPDTLRELNNLRYLSMPARFANTLTEASLPESLEVLTVEMSPKGSGRLPKTLVYPSLRVLGGIGFTKENVPHLEEIAFNPRRKNQAKEVARYEHIPSVLAFDMDSPQQWDTPIKLAPKTLSINGGKLTSLERLPEFKGLQALSISRLQQLTAVEGLAECRDVRSLEILYCNNINDISPILRMPKLERLTIVSCNRINLEEVRDDLVAMKLKELAITGDVHL